MIMYVRVSFVVLRFRFLMALLLLLLPAAGSQAAGSAPPDSSAKTQTVKSPRMAMILSACMPGLGQAYNEQKMKSVLVFAGELGLAVNAVYHNQMMMRSLGKLNEARIMYQHSSEGMSETPAAGELQEMAGLEAVIDFWESNVAFYRENRRLSIWWYLGIFFLNILDAYVDAHLWDFDTGPDLTFMVDPAAGRNVCIGMRFPLKMK